MKNINNLFENMKIAEIGFKSTLLYRQKSLFHSFSVNILNNIFNRKSNKNQTLLIACDSFNNTI